MKRKRNYQEHHTEEFIYKDMMAMYDIIKDLALYDWNHIGAEVRQATVKMVSAGHGIQGKTF